MTDAPTSWGGLPALAANGATNDFEWKRLSEIQVRPLEFVRKPFLQKAAFHLLVGVKNAGKGTWLAHWAAQTTIGELGPRRQVIWVAIGEDSYAMDVRPRIEAAGGDPANVTVLLKGRLVLPDAIEELGRVASVIGDAGMIVIDPLGGSLAGDKNTNRDSDIRPALAGLNETADITGAIVIGVRHLSIKHERRAGGTLSSILGSSDWVNIPRAVLALVHDDVDRASRHLFVVTGNRVRDDTPGLMFRIEGHQPEGWEEEVTVARELGESAKDPDELLAFRRPKATKTDAARTLILEVLADQPLHQMESSVLDAAIAEKTGLAVKTLRNLRNEMKDAGLVKPVPQKDEDGEIQRWFVTLTEAGLTRSGPGHSPDPLPHHSQATPQKGSGLDKPFQPGSGIQIPSSASVRKGSGHYDPADPDFVTTDDQLFGDSDIPF